MIYTDFWVLSFSFQANEYLGFKSKLIRELNLMVLGLRIMVKSITFWNYILALY